MSFLPFLQRTWQAMLHDFWRKLLALFLAALLYCTVDFQYIRSEPLRLTGVPVEVALPPGTVNVDREVPPVPLVLNGSSRQLSLLSQRDIQCRVTIPEGSFVRGKPFSLKLNPTDFVTPSGVSISHIEPRELMLNLEPIVNRRVPIEVRFDSLDRLARDYQVDRIRCVPDEVQVTGPESQVNELRMISTVPIPLDSSVTEGFDYSAQLRRPDDLVLSPQRVAVRIDIARKYGTRNFTALPVRVILSPDQREKLHAELLGVPQIEVVLSGPESQLATLKSSNLRAFLDLSELRTPGTYSLEPGCLITGVNESELKVKLIRPEKISVRITAGK